MVSAFTQDPCYLFYSNDAGDNMQVVNPSHPLPVTGTATITPVKSTVLTSSQVTVPATANGILILASNTARLGATIVNNSSQTIYISQQPTGLTSSNGLGIPAGSAYNIDEPLYTGAIYGIVASTTGLATVVELT